MKSEDRPMYVVCLDLEGVLIPEIWINVAEKEGVEELKLTTRDISDYDVLMRKRIGILKENNITIRDIQALISEMDPLPGAKDFLDSLRERTQVFLLSDTFRQFANPLMRKLDYPTLLCNSLVIDSEGYITDYEMRQQDGKRKAVDAIRSMGYNIVAAGDSYNDISMLKNADAGILFKSPQNVIDEYPQFPTAFDYDELNAQLSKYIS